MHNVIHVNNINKLEKSGNLLLKNIAVNYKILQYQLSFHYQQGKSIFPTYPPISAFSNNADFKTLPKGEMKRIH